MKCLVVLVMCLVTLIASAKVESQGNILSSNKYLVDQTQIPQVVSASPLLTSQIPLTAPTVNTIPTITTQMPTVVTQAPYYTTNPLYYNNYYYPQMYATPYTTNTVTQVPLTTSTTTVIDPNAKYVFDTGLNPTGSVKIIQ